MHHLKWERLESQTSGAAQSMASTHWYRARLPHGWLLQAMRQRMEMVGGREVMLEGGMADVASTTFVPFGPAPWN